MGKRDRERIERIQAGKEMPIAAQRMAKDPLGRAALRLASRKGVIKELSAGDTTEQVGRLDSLVGTGALPGSKLKSAIMSKAPGEMDKAIKKFQKEGREVTVDSLCAQVKTEPGFLPMCERVGLSLEWFERLARERMEKHAIGV
jgi:hypothetical protein